MSEPLDDETIAEIQRDASTRWSNVPTDDEVGAAAQDVFALLAEVRRLRAALETARAEAIEEAAAVCERYVADLAGRRSDAAESARLAGMELRCRIRELAARRP